ncbi:MAG: alpha/beta fold hydrolase [Cyanobacteria bacterium P01_H01_bin.21]
MAILWCLHGNLQQPNVWDNLSQISQALQIKVINLWNTSAHSCWAWADAFCKTVRAADTDSKHYLLGYSLGGRLAMHALIQAPELWSKAIIVSADPGTTDEQIRARCLKRDRIWANRFLTEPWTELLAEWDALPVFCGRPCSIARREEDFDRQQIARLFEVYSKGHMDDLTPHLRSLRVPITYVTGIDDERYCRLGQTLSSQCPSLTHITVNNAGHRVPWEQPDIFANILHHSLNL